VVNPDRAALLDALAQRALARLAPLTFDIAETDAERDAVLRLRYDCVVAERWSDPTDFRDGREHDEYDDDATFIVCRDGDAIAGSLRLVAPRPDRPLPTERDFGIVVRPAGQVLEVGRIVVAPGARAGRSHLILGGLCARSWLEAYARGFDRALSTAAPEVIDLYASLGLRITVLAPAKAHWGTMRAPIQIEGDEATFGFLTG
jgi:N-acyl-L-homoserine lactone synthetase